MSETLPAVGVILDVDALGHQLVNTSVLFKHRRQLGLHYAAASILTRIQWYPRIEQRNGILQAALEHHHIVTVTLRAMAIGANIFFMLDAVAQPSQLL